MFGKVTRDLYRASRPGYPESGHVSVDAVRRWIAAAQDLGIRSVICLLDEKQLQVYHAAGGLLELYNAAGLRVQWIPVADHCTPPLNTQQLREVKQAYDAAEKPVVIHCSAGIDRTGAATEYLQRFPCVPPALAEVRETEWPDDRVSPLCWGSIAFSINICMAAC